MKVYFLRKGSRAYTAHSLGEAYQTAAAVLPDAIIFGLTCKEEATIAANFLSIVPDVQLIVSFNEVLYKK